MLTRAAKEIIRQRSVTYILNNCASFEVYAYLRQRRSPPSRNLSPRQQLQLGRPGPRSPRVQQHHQTLRFSDLRDQQLVHYQSPVASGTVGTGIYCGTF